MKTFFDFKDLPRLDLTIAGLVLAALLVFPFFPHSSYAMSTVIQFLMFALYGMGWNTIGGYGGQVDLGLAQYLGIGAYTTAVSMIRWNTPFWVSMPIGVVIAMTWCFIVGYSVFRLKGHYFAIATIAMSLVLKDIFEVWSFVGASRGLEIPTTPYASPDFLHLIFTRDIYYYYIILAFFVIGFLYINWFRCAAGVSTSVNKGQRRSRQISGNQRALGQDQDLCRRRHLCERGGVVSRMLHQEHRT